jgi:hypothetical protein
MNQHPPAHYEGWMVSGQQTVFLFGSSFLTNHGGYLSAFFKKTTYLLH